jgi:hypothetical protein
MSEFTGGQPTLPFGGDVDIDAAIAAARCAGDATAIAKLMEVRDARPAGWRGGSPADASQCCQVCFDELGAKPAVQFPCAHWMCRVCAHTYTQENLTFLASANSNLTFSGCAFCPGDASVTLRDVRMLLRETPASSNGPPAPRARSTRRASWYFGSRNADLFNPDMCGQAALEQALISSLEQTPRPSTIASPPAPFPGGRGPTALLPQQTWGGDPLRKLGGGTDADAAQPARRTVRSPHKPTEHRRPALRRIIAQPHHITAATRSSTAATAGK